MPPHQPVLHNFKKGGVVIVQCGREFTTEQITQISEIVETFGNLSQTELTHTVCEQLEWYTASGANKFEACKKLLSLLEDRGLIKLPAKKKTTSIPPKKKAVKNRIIFDETPVEGNLSDIGSVNLRIVADKNEKTLFNEYLRQYHYLGYKKPFGYFLRYYIEISGTILGCILLSGPAKSIKSRDQWIGWNTNERLRNQGFIVNNGRFLIFPWVNVRYLASHVLGKMVRVLAQDWYEQWGYRPVLLETFVDPQHFDGTCYQAANFTYLGMTSGTGLTRPGKKYTSSPKKIFVCPLADNFRQVLCSSETVGKVL